MYQRVDLTEAAANLIATLKEKHGPLMFHQSGGCCDGSQPMCFEKGDFKIGGSDIKIGNIADCEFFMSKDQYEYWKHTHLTIDVIPGRGSSFSLEIPLGFRFIVQSRLFTEAELQDLEPIVYFD
ncbi:MAG: hypothetical protein RI940_429 [Bacteroidota bacterium]|jgi:uncharacterized protein (DUF779 family)